MPLTPNADPVALLDGRIRAAWTRRASSERYSEAYWEADDDLAWLRMVRDEISRTGHVRPEVRAMLAVPPVPVEVDGGGVPAAAPADVRDRAAVLTSVAAIDEEPGKRKRVAVGAA